MAINIIQRKNHINLGDIPKKKDAEGRVICLNCDKILSGRQIKYCGKECADDWMCKHSHQWMRARLIKRVDWICNHCHKKFDSSQLILDHITPIALGGEEFDEKNMQILCVSCNKIKTKQDFGHIAEAKRSNKLEFIGQKKVGDF